MARGSGQQDRQASERQLGSATRPGIEGPLAISSQRPLDDGALEQHRAASLVVAELREELSRVLPERRRRWD